MAVIDLRRPLGPNAAETSDTLIHPTRRRRSRLLHGQRHDRRGGVERGPKIHRHRQGETIRGNSERGDCIGGSLLPRAGTSGFDDERAGSLVRRRMRLYTTESVNKDLLGISADYQNTANKIPPRPKR